MKTTTLVSILLSISLATILSLGTASSIFAQSQDAETHPDYAFRPNHNNISSRGVFAYGTSPTRVKNPPTKTWAVRNSKRDDIKSPEKCAETGVCLLAMMELIGPVSLFSDFSQIAASGWQGGLEDDNDVREGYFKNLNDFITRNGFNILNFQKWRFRLDQWWIPEGETTYYIAYYTFWTNIKEGVVIRESSWGPKDPFQHDDDDPLPPPLPVRQDQWSDVAWLSWQHACGSDQNCLRSLNWILVYDIQNDVGEGVVSWIEESVMEEASLWPGLEFDAYSIYAQAMIGSPNGYGVAWLLINQAYLVGSRIIDKVHLFLADDETTICFAFHIEDADLEMGGF